MLRYVGSSALLPLLTLTGLESLQTLCVSTTSAQHATYAEPISVSPGFDLASSCPLFLTTHRSTAIQSEGSV